ncbi:MAG: hypothetical protein JWM89_1173 [Acidimicrobiales bacterium]|nr:hypothetical protein [Acidimicrobiales bacterium]
MEVGRDLEQRIAAFFGQHGYVTQCNAFAEGRSGGRHEIDVLAEKSDALTTYRVAVECKAWQAPIEKDVVSKLHYIVNDAGLSKGIIVSLGGCRSGAERTAADLGIELWGPDEIRRHLGDGVVDQMGAGAADASGATVAWGFPLRASTSAAEQLIRSSGKGRLGVRTLEDLTWFSVVWMPAYCVRVSVAQPEQKRFKTILRSITVDNVYEAFGGVNLGRLPAPSEEVRFDPKLALPPLLSEAKLQAGIRKAFAAYERVTAPAAVQRHLAALALLGIPTPASSLSIDASDLVYVPIYVGVLEASGQHRVEAVDGRTGLAWDQVSTILTSHLPHLRSHFAGS